MDFKNAVPTDDPKVMLIDGVPHRFDIHLRRIGIQREVLRARDVLLDAEAALDAWEETEDAVRGRVFYAAVLMLLRAVGHVLHKVDVREHPEIAPLVAASFATWKEDPDEYPLFTEFIDPERNAILKEYEFGVGPEQVVGIWENLQTGERGEMPIPTKIYAYEDGPFAGEDVRDVARQAVEFWRDELDELEGAIGKPQP
jgi:hypothetical protein